MPSDGTTTRNSVIQKVQNRNNMAEMLLKQKMLDFKKHLALKVVAIEMERLEWHTFLKELRKCDSDDLEEFVPFLTDEFGEEEYEKRVRKLKTRFRDLFSAVELGMKDEKLSMDYVKIKEAGEKAQKDYRMVKCEMKNRPKPPPLDLTERNNSPAKPISRNENPQKGGGKPATGFITSMGAAPPTPAGIDQVAQANRPLESAGGAQNQLAVPRFGASRPFFPSIPKTPAPAQPEPKPEEKKKDDDLDSELDLGPDSDEEWEEKKRKQKKKEDQMRKMLDKNAQKLKRRRRMRKPKKPLENRIEEFFTKISDLRIEPPKGASGTNAFLPPIGVSTY